MSIFTDFHESLTDGLTDRLMVRPSHRAQYAYYIIHMAENNQWLLFQDQRRNRRTDGQTLLWRCEDASKSHIKKNPIKYVLVTSSDENQIQYTC